MLTPHPPRVWALHAWGAEDRPVADVEVHADPAVRVEVVREPDGSVTVYAPDVVLRVTPRAAPEWP